MSILSHIPTARLYAELGRRRAAMRTTRGGPKPTCTCGECRTCKKRESVRRWRAAKKEKR